MKIFISYRRSQGIDIAARIASFLSQRNNDVFYDINSMHLGAFDEQIYDNIKQSQYVISILSKGALDRCVDPNDWVRKELECAFANNITVVPLMLPGFTFPDDLPTSIEKIKTCHGLEYNAVLFDLVMEKLFLMLNNDEQNDNSSLLSSGISVQVEITHCCKAEMDFWFNNEECPDHYKGKVGFKDFLPTDEINPYWFPALKVSVYNLQNNAIVLGANSPEIQGQIKMPQGQIAKSMCTRTIMDPTQGMTPRIIKPGESITDVMVGSLGIMGVQPFIAKDGKIVLEVNGERNEIPVTAFHEAIDYAEKVVDHDIDKLFKRVYKLYYFHE